jgi:hypothetical protein
VFLAADFGVVALLLAVGAWSFIALWGGEH